MNTVLSIKIDVDTERGTKIGVPNLLSLLQELNLKATFLFSFGPDNTGRAIKRIFRPGFFTKVQRTNVVKVYGIKTLLNGVLIRGPVIGDRHADLMRNAHVNGFEVGVHCYDHIKWQDNLHHMNEAMVRVEVQKARSKFEEIFGFSPKTMGAAGWQANKFSLAAYDDSNLMYASDTRGNSPFFPTVDKKEFSTLQLPTTLPTLDELLGRPEYPLESITDTLIAKILPDQLNVMTIHAELEGMSYLNWFKDFLQKCLEKNIIFLPMYQIAKECLKKRHLIPKMQMVQKEIDGRTGLVSCQSESHILPLNKINDNPSIKNGK